MRALEFFQTGSLDNLRVEEVAKPRPAPGEVLPSRAETFPLEEGPRVYRSIAESKIKGKPILVP
jgi:hypothetical protein